ncbi:DNA-binding response regulator (plasmid) [Paraburkholderia sp. PGU19]|uniref:response regulator transcription factor n=1 Tax=Paraburkholderia sp. PGU19 TaxID=2735434 RepID=UPI0015DA13F5|nr:response regulator transcription factor [Paraburkholderia sp. PGU19]BCG04328.1 DNA-binding response regulator [Paraburkholderia sp. PGU19]
MCTGAILDAERLVVQKILLIEDDAKLATLMCEYLGHYGFDVSTASRGDTAVDSVRKNSPDLVVLDVMLPGLNGVDVCKGIRTFSTVPVLILTARGESHDQVLGLDIGADDYVVKPADPPVLLARIRALLRRAGESAQTGAPTECDPLRYGRLAIYVQDRKVIWRDQTIDLTSTELNLLLILASAPGVVLSRDAILQKLRGIGFDGIDRSTDVGISKLRRKFDDSAGEPRRIKTVWGRGYLFAPSEWED